jgi:hypothetical protein
MRLCDSRIAEPEIQAAANALPCEQIRSGSCLRGRRLNAFQLIRCEVPHTNPSAYLERVTTSISCHVVPAGASLIDPLQTYLADRYREASFRT